MPPVVVDRRQVLPTSIPGYKLANISEPPDPRNPKPQLGRLSVADLQMMLLALMCLVRPADKPSLSIASRLDLLPAIASILVAGLAALFTGLKRNKSGTPTFYLHVAYAILRKASARLSPLQLQWISPSTEKVYKQYMQSHGAVSQSIELEYDAKGHWIGDKHAQNVLIWYHGGGFCLPANIGYFKFWESLIQSSSAASKDLAVFAVAYTLAPNAQYPMQLIQSVEALRYILTRTNRAPANVMLGGDSAGRNLAVGVLSHLTSPHEAIAKLDFQEPLAGTVLIAPWTSLDVRADTEFNCLGDVITPDVAKPWCQAYLGSAKHDCYTDASTAPSGWFQHFKTQEILVLAGQNEIMLSSIRQFVEKVKVSATLVNREDKLTMQTGFPSVELFVGRQEGHVAPIYNLYVGDNEETQQEKRLKAWLRELL
ncbi:Alpha/Beta hydrolase protein [Aspergillus pseudotamarii]|uniref:Alpha/Beta hydrolase protein n=1 Tax=Aspergillus pseudotamarii TaxID=132259 RepID=A0A5N6T5D0_ASPPS|nr:Alpha/Beta hydrolase protein [Aspergillus pseudotamarii]KAE8141502.1 Alpha/Beta hydrolase protein [Aspergillus pseudotamarii]